MNLKRFAWLAALPFLYVVNGSECHVDFNGNSLIHNGGRNELTCDQLKNVSDLLNLSYALGQINMAKDLSSEQNDTETLNREIDLYKQVSQDITEVYK